MKVPSLHLALGLALLGIAPRADAAPPNIGYQPRNRTVVLYQPTAFGVIASGTVPLSYQWLKDGVPIAGATNDQIFLARAQFSNAGLYAVAVSNAEGRVTSADAGLTVNAPRAGDIDFTYAIGSSINGPVHVLALQPDGKIVIGGDFTLVNGGVRRRVARLHHNATIDLMFMDGLTGADNSVSSLAVLGDGKILIGGSFTNVNGVARNRIARLNADGSLDTGFLDGLSGANSTVWSLAVQNDGKVVIGGAFGDVNGTTRSGIARLNADGTIDTGFLGGLSGVEGEVRCVAGQNDGRVVIGGNFQTVNGVTRNRIARLNADGSTDASFLDGLSGANSTVSCLQVQSDDKVVLGGAFGDVNGASRSRIARLNADGTIDTGFLAGLSGANDEVRSVAEASDGKLLIGGRFTQFNGVTRNRAARLKMDGTLDSEFQNTFAAEVNSIVVQSNGKALCGGAFTTVNGVSRHYLARLNSDGTLDGTSPIDRSGVEGLVASIALQRDGKALLGGEFAAVNGVSRNHVARLNLDGSLDGAFLNGLSGADGTVSSIIVDRDGKALIGGTFTAVNGLTRRRIARLNPDGTLDIGFGGGSAGVGGVLRSVGPAVDALGLQDDGRVVLGGAFTGVDSVTRHDIARLKFDGSLDEGFSADVSAGYTVCRSIEDCWFVYYHVYCLATQADGKLVIGGDFDYVNGIIRHGIARINADGSLDTTFQNGLSGANAAVYCLTLQSDGKVLIGGAFGDVNGARRSGIARLNVDGSIDTEFQNGVTGANSVVYSLARQSDGKVVIGGDFTLFNDVSRNRIARLNPDGTLDTDFQNGLSGANGRVSSLALPSDGTVLIGGAFTTVNGVTAVCIARLWGSADVSPHIRNISRSEGDVNLIWDALPNRTYRVQYKEHLSAITWTDLAGDVPSMEGMASKTDTTFGASPQRYYRVTLLP